MTATDTVVALDDRNSIPRVLVAQAERRGRKTFIAFEPSGIRISYEDLVAAAEAGSTRLVNAHGFGPGKMAALYLPNGLDFIVAWFTCLFAGCVDVPINHEYRKATLLFALQISDAELVFTDSEGLRRLVDPEVQHQLTRLKLVVLCGDERDCDPAPLRDTGALVRLVTLRELTAAGPRSGVWQRLQASSLASIRFTSGTTGKAKGIMHSHLHMLGKSMAINRVLDALDSDVLYSPFPLHHNLASINGLIGMLQAGGTMVSATRFSASRYWPAIRQCGATLSHILNPLIPMLLAQPPTAEDRKHAVRYLWTAPGSPEFVERFGAQPVHSYALSEVGVIAYRRDGGQPGSCATGIPLPEMEVRIVDEIDRPLPPGELGQIVIRPRHLHRLTLGYYSDLPATITAFRNLWYHTGDAGYIAADGQLHFTGRLGDTVRRRGVNISSEQIEAEVLRHAVIEACAVVGVPSPLGDEEMHALVVLKASAERPATVLADLSRFLAERLPRDHVPRYFELATDLPRTPTGKISRSEVRRSVGRTPVWDRETDGWITDDPSAPPA